MLHRTVVPKDIVPVLVCFVLTALSGCAEPPPPFVPLVERDIAVRYCFDGVPHQAGSKPWILGGTCCCTPSDALMAMYHRDGICLEMSLEDLIALYEQHDIHLALTHRGCNNLCAWGPHVTRGGRCMAPPTPGTRNYQEIVLGHTPGGSPPGVATSETTAAAGLEE